MPLNKQTIFIIGGVVVVLLIIVYINNQTKTLKTELKTLAEEQDEFKKQTIGHIRNIYGIVSPESLMNDRRKVVGNVKITRGQNERKNEVDEMDEDEKNEEENKAIQQEINKINELERKGERKEEKKEERKEEKKEERKEEQASVQQKELYADITGNKSGHVLQPVAKEELERIRQEEMNKFRK